MATGLRMNGVEILIYFGLYLTAGTTGGNVHPIVDGRPRKVTLSFVARHLAVRSLLDPLMSQIKMFSDYLEVTFSIKSRLNMAVIRPNIRNFTQG